MKNVQVIDGAENCSYNIFAFSDEAFLVVFPKPGQDIAVIDEVESRLSDEEYDKVFNTAWRCWMDKKDVRGIHGTLFYELTSKKKYYPNRMEKDLDGPPRQRGGM